MDRGAPAAVAAALLAALATGSCDRDTPPGAAREATSVPAAWAMAGPAAGDSTALLWTFRTEDCLSCMAVDYDVRRVQARFGPAVPLIAVHVGRREDSAIPRAYFRTRRLRVDRAVTVSPNEFRRLYPGVALPALALLRGRAIAWSTSSPAGRRAARVQLDTLVQRVREGRPPTSGGPGRPRLASGPGR